MKKREERHCVDLVATLTDLIPPFLLPPSLPATPPPPPTTPFLVLSFFPPVLQGIKTSIHAPEETHSRGGGGRERGEDEK